MNVGLITPCNAGVQQAQVAWPSIVAHPSTAALQTALAFCCAYVPSAGYDKQCIRQTMCD